MVYLAQRAWRRCSAFCFVTYLIAKSCIISGLCILNLLAIVWLNMFVRIIFWLIVGKEFLK